MPLFTAAASIYKSGHYWTSGAFGEASEIVGHEFFAPLNRTCGVCYLDENSACVRDCTNCPPGQPPNGCTEFTLTCRPERFNTPVLLNWRSTGDPNRERQ